MAALVYKDDNDPEVRKYTHHRAVNEVQITPTEIIRDTVNSLELFAEPSLKMLAQLKVLPPWIVKNGLKNGFFYLLEQFNRNKQQLQRCNSSVAYSALKIISFMSSCRKALHEQGY